jgi:hypothetical protein
VSADRPVSPLFRAALATLGTDPDPLATMARLRDAFPKASSRDLGQVVRETAVTFHCAGIAPKVGA